MKRSRWSIEWLVCVIEMILLSVLYFDDSNGGCYLGLWVSREFMVSLIAVEVRCGEEIPSMDL